MLPKRRIVGINPAVTAGIADFGGLVASDYVSAATSIGALPGLVARRLRTETGRLIWPAATLGAAASFNSPLNRRPLFLKRVGRAPGRADRALAWSQSSPGRAPGLRADRHQVAAWSYRARLYRPQGELRRLAWSPRTRASPGRGLVTPLRLVEHCPIDALADT